MQMIVTKRNKSYKKAVKNTIYSALRLINVSISVSKESVSDAELQK